MPSLKAHLYWDHVLFGRSFRKIHREMDKPFKQLGRRHRVLFHDSLSAIRIAEQLYPGDPVAVRAALFHIHLDEICTRDPDFRKTAEAAAILWGGKKGRGGKR